MNDTLHAPQALLPNGWAHDVLLAWDDAGTLIDLRAGVAPPAGAMRAGGPVVPGIANLHSHAFQRAFAGLTEHRGEADDSFWTWRDLMYRFALAISPDQLEAVALQLYIEMLQAGYTAVCEFHYLHHDAGGARYAEPAEMALRLQRAADAAGIALTLLPVLYQTSGFGGAEPRPDQRRFIDSVGGLLGIVERLRGAGCAVGIAPHSLRAVTPPALADLLAGARALDPALPIHIHIAEQQREVDECIAWSGARPVRWLLDHAPVDARWCLVHATHLDAAERDGIVASGAVAGLCPTTEANLGDGLFDAAAFDAAGGAWGIGSDSHASVDAAEELRLLEYGQRLALGRRNLLASPGRPQVADHLWQTAVRGGAKARGRGAGLAVGQAADFVVLGGDPALDGLPAAAMLASHVFARQGGRAISDVWVAGRRRIADGRHALADDARARFVAARRALVDAS
ncbi:MAG: formimidoylglutamate deiminase [Proteobacteria bacterium]|nr:formimidoylglutamate deiminase [Pseudomonadota bacterium]